MSSNVGYATLQIIPSAKGFGARLGRETSPDIARHGREGGKQFSRSFSAAAVPGAKLVGGAFAALGVGAVIKSSVDLEAQFSQTMNTMAAVANVPAPQIKDLSALAMKMGADTVFSAGQAADAMLELAKGGLSAATIKAGALKGTLTLAAAGGTDLATAATIASNALNTFGLAGKDMGAVAAALAGGANASSASVESLGEALGQVGPGAKTAGLSLQQTVAVLSAFDAAGIKGSDAGTSLKTMLTRLVPQTDAAASAMRTLGLKFTDAHGAFLPIANIAGQLQAKLSKLSDAQRTTALQTIFGSDATRAATVLMNIGAKGVEDYTKATSDLGAAQRVADSRMKGTAGAIEAMKGSIETAKLAFGQLLAPAITAGAHALAAVFNALSTTLTGVGPLLGRIGDGIKALFDLLVHGDFTASFRQAFGLEEDDPIVGKLFDFRDKVATAIGAIRDTFDTVGGKIQDALDTFVPDVKTFAKNLADGLADTAGPLIDGVKRGVQGGDWKPLGKAVGDALVKVLQGSADLLGKLTTAFGDMLSKVDWVGVGIAVGRQLPSLLIGLAAGLLNLDFGGLLKGLAAHWKDILIAVLTVAFTPGRVLSKVGELLERIPLVGKLLAWALKHFAKFSKKLVGLVGDVLGAMGKAFLHGLLGDGVTGAFGRFVDRIVIFLFTRIARFELAALDMAGGLVKGLVKGAELLGRAVRWLLGKLLGWLVAGLKLVGRLALAALKFVWDKLPDVLSGALKTAVKGVGKLLDGIVGTVKGLPGRIATAARGMWDGIKDAFKGALNWIIDKWNGLEFGIPGINKGPIHFGGFKLGTPNIPRLAAGGILPARPGGWLVNASEAGETEAVIPLSKLAAMLPRQERRTDSRPAASAAPTVVQVVLNDRVLAEAVLDVAGRDYAAGRKDF